MAPFLFVPSVDIAVTVTVLPFPAFFVDSIPLLFMDANFLLFLSTLHASFVLAVLLPFFPPVFWTVALMVSFLPALAAL